MSKYYHKLGHEHFFPTSDKLRCSQIVLPLYSVEYVPGSAVKFSVNNIYVLASGNAIKGKFAYDMRQIF